MNTDDPEGARGIFSTLTPMKNKWTFYHPPVLCTLTQNEDGTAQAVYSNATHNISLYGILQQKHEKTLIGSYFREGKDTKEVMFDIGLTAADLKRYKKLKFKVFCHETATDDVIICKDYDMDDVCTESDIETYLSVSNFPNVTGYSRVYFCVPLDRSKTCSLAVSNSILYDTTVKIYGIT